jgi:hypothetical protein
VDVSSIMICRGWWLSEPWETCRGQGEGTCVKGGWLLRVRTGPLRAGREGKQASVVS